MPLDEYRRKRRFGKTPEPTAESSPRLQRSKSRKRGPLFVVQKHAASRLHYDFRLEHDGISLSWAVPKGPSLDPTQKRLAVQVEDHPLGYADFEGVIPTGEYGGGSVIVWDRGSYVPEGEMSAMLSAGRLKFRLEGEKLTGLWNLVRIGGRSADGKNWLLIKSRDEAAMPLARGDVLAERPESVLSGRTVEEIAAMPARVWKSGKAQPIKRQTAKAKTRSWAARLKKMPATIAPQLASLAERVPDGEQWLHEIKHDGYRLLARLKDGAVQLFTRGGHDWTSRFPEIVTALAALPCGTAWIDGEVAFPDAAGITRFVDLQSALATRSTGSLVYYAFDLLHLDGYDLRPSPLLKRKELLAELLNGVGSRRQFVEHVLGEGPAFAEAACRERLEGLVSKRSDAPYRSGRTKSWLKWKCQRSDEFFIGGFTTGAGTRSGLGALLLGEKTRDGQLVYAGRVGTGFDQRTLHDLR